MHKPVALKGARTVLVLEVELGRLPDGEGAVRVVSSIPGREGTATRTWQVGPSGLTDVAVGDLHGWMARTLFDAVTAAQGVQLKLL